MINQPTIHEDFTPDGPLTYEYSLNAIIPEEHLRFASPFTRQFLQNTPSQIVTTLSSHWEGIADPLVPLAQSILSFAPSSIAVQVNDDLSNSWLVFRGPKDEIYLLGQSPKPSEEIRDADWINHVAGLNDLISYFGNLGTSEIPPSSGFGVGDRLIHEADEQCCWGVTGHWENALPIYSTGSPETVCVATDGKMGLWTIETFIQISPSLRDFIKMFIHRKTAPKQTEWWW